MNLLPFICIAVLSIGGYLIAGYHGALIGAFIMLLIIAIVNTFVYGRKSSKFPWER